MLVNGKAIRGMPHDAMIALMVQGLQLELRVKRLDGSTGSASAGAGASAGPGSGRSAGAGVPNARKPLHTNGSVSASRVRGVGVSASNAADGAASDGASDTGASAGVGTAHSGSEQVKTQRSKRRRVVESSDDDGDDDDEVPARRSAPAPAPVNNASTEWACTVCTFINKGRTTTCEMCSATIGATTALPEQAAVAASATSAASEARALADAAGSGSSSDAGLVPKGSSAAVESNHGGAAGAGGGGAHAVASEPAPQECVVCLEAPVDAALVHSGTAHRHFCFACASELKRRKQKCPICRKRIQAVVKVFG